MLKHLRIKNFKAISDLAIKFTPFTVLIGENSCAKSTILQAIDFMASLTKRDVDEYLKERGWSFHEIKSKFVPDCEPIVFEAIFGTDDWGVGWNISVNYQMKEWEIEEDIFEYNPTDGAAYSVFNDLMAGIGFSSAMKKLLIKSSVIKLYNSKMESGQNKLLQTLKTELTSINNFELLSANMLRKNGSISDNHDTIGVYGEFLAEYISNLNDADKRYLNKMVSGMLGYIIEIDPQIRLGKGDAVGWYELYLNEKWYSHDFRIENRYLSDGVLRILALSAILLKKQGGANQIILLDEIEDGINPLNVENFVNYISSLANDGRRQIIVTTHSPVLLNYVDENGIIFMWRDREGSINAEPLFKAKKMKDMLKFLNPGEVWLNYSRDEIVNLLDGAPAAPEANTIV